MRADNLRGNEGNAMKILVTDDEKVSALRASTLEAVKEFDQRLTIHDFRYVEGTTHSNLIFDIVVPFEITLSDNEIRNEIDIKIKKLDPKYFTVITVDRQ